MAEAKRYFRDGRNSVNMPRFTDLPTHTGIITTWSQLVSNRVDVFALGSARNRTRATAVPRLALTNTVYTMDQPPPTPIGSPLDPDVTAVTRLNENGGSGVWYRDALMNIGMVEAIMTALNPRSSAKVIIVDETNPTTTFDLTEADQALLTTTDTQTRERIHVDQSKLEEALRGQTKMHQFFERLKPLLQGRLHAVSADQVESVLAEPIKPLVEVVPFIGKNEPVLIEFKKDDGENVGVKSLLAGVLAGMGYWVKISFEEETPTAPGDGYHGVPLLKADSVGKVESPATDFPADELKELGGKVRKANGFLTDTPWAVLLYGMVTEEVGYVPWGTQTDGQPLPDVLAETIAPLEGQGKTGWADLIKSVSV